MKHGVHLTFCLTILTVVFRTTLVNEYDDDGDDETFTQLSHTAGFGHKLKYFLVTSSDY